MGNTTGDGATDVVESALAAARVLVALSARSVAAVDDVVTLPQLRVLMLVAGRERVTVGAVARTLQVHPSNATRIVDRLAAGGFVERHPDPGDRRTLVLGLTGAGQALVDDVLARRRAAIEEILDALPAERRSAIGPAFDAFARAGVEIGGDDGLLDWSGR